MVVREAVPRKLGNRVKYDNNNKFITLTSHSVIKRRGRGRQTGAKGEETVARSKKKTGEKVRIPLAAI